MRRLARTASMAVLVIPWLLACHHKPEPAPTQVAETDLAGYQAEIRKVVKDSSRAEQLVGMTNEMGQLVRDIGSQEKSDRAAIAALDADYGASRAQYDSAIAHAATQRRGFANKMVAVRLHMASVATEAEWEQLKSTRVRMLDADLNAVQP